jgi:hypothetical protein
MHCQVQYRIELGEKFCDAPAGRLVRAHVFGLSFWIEVTLVRAGLVGQGFDLLTMTGYRVQPK